MTPPFHQRMKSVTDAFTSFYYRLPWVSRRRKPSLFMQLMLIACAWGIIIFALAVVGLWWTAGQVIQDNVRRQSIQWLNKFDELGTPLFISGDPLQFESIQKYIISFPEVSFLRYVATDGRTELASYFANGIDPNSVAALNDEQLNALRQVEEGEEKPRFMEEIPGRSILRVCSPAVIRSISSDGLLNFSIEKTSKEKVRVIGFVDVGFNYNVYREHLWKRIFYGSFLILGLFIGTFLLGRIVIRQALRPLIDLQVPLGKLARGETDIHVESHGAASEIVAIGNALNTTIAALKERDRELSRLANYDTLTGLFNRHSFNRELEKEKARILLNHHLSGLLFIDLDRFKEINDTVGHAAGDELLVQIARLLRATVRSSDIVSRLGGDEFTIILNDVSEEHTSKVAEQICTAMRGFSFSAEGQTFHIHCSIGITMIDWSETSASAILSQADTACHEAKKSGRNGFRRYVGIDEASLQLNGIGLREQLETALRNKTFFLVYVPIREKQNGPVGDYEALLRMRASGDEFPASAFVSDAERFDLIQQIDRAVINMALRQLMECDKELRLSINLSAKTLQQSNILEFIAVALTSAQVAPQRLIFEIPERAILDNATLTKSFMDGIRALGCRIAIDDFGVSLNAINLLRDLPIDQLKLDAAIVSNIASPIGYAVVNLIVQVARELGIQTAAKNVSCVDEAHQLEQLGIDQLQGDFIGQPIAQLPATKTIAFTATHL